MVLFPKLRQQIMVSAALAFRAHHIFYLRMAAHQIADTQAAWWEVATRPVAARHAIPRWPASRRLKIRHARMLFGVACLLLLLALAITQPAAPHSAPYLTYDKISSLPSAPLEAVSPPHSGASPCSMLTIALDLCEP